jgi:salicylate hydroxylase
MKNLKIVIVGAGMGGLEAGLALATDGHEVTVLEGAEKFEEVNAFHLK